jgi:septal ring factor EnvC (AmiA/AmiB activator)
MEGGMMEGLEVPDEVPVSELSLNPADLLDQIADGPEPAPEIELEPVPQGGLPDEASLGGLGLGAAAAAGAALGAVAAVPVPVAALQDLQEKLAALATQVMGGSVAVVRLEGQLAEKDQALAAMEQRLQSSQDEGQTLRRELSDLRAQLEETLRQRAQDSDKSATEFKERLALVEDRQIQLDRDVRTEIERAVPREAARVIREEIAALAASMHEE